MNDPQSTKSGMAELKDVYESSDRGRNALSDALKLRRKRLASKRLGTPIADQLAPTLPPTTLGQRGL